MGIKFVCPNGHKLNVKDHLAGKKGLCPHCGARFQIPDASTEVPVVATNDAVGSADVASTVPPGEAGGSSIRGTGLMPPVGPGSRSAAPSTGSSSIGLGESPRSAVAPTALAAPVPAMPAGPSRSTIAARPDPLAEAPDATWYMRLASGDQYGPAKSAEMREWLDQSRIPGDALVWREGWADWKRADETFASLAPTSAAPGPAIPAMPAGYPGAAPPGMAPAPLMPGAYPMPGAPVPGAMPGMMAPGMVVPGMPMPGAAVPAMPHTGAPMGMPAAGAPLVHPAPGAFPGAMPMAAPPGAMPAAPVGAYPVGMAAPGAVRAAVAVPVATAPVGASPLAAPSTPEDGDTGEFLAAAAGQSRRSESSEPVRPRKKSNAVAVTMTVMMVLAAIGLGGFAYYLITQEKGYNPVVVENANVGVKFAFPRSATAGETPENVKSPAGAVSYTVREADGLGYNFFAIIIEVPNREEAAAKKDELLTFGGELAAKRVGAAKGTSGRAVSLSGNSGREFTAESGGRQVRARAYMIRNYLCVLGLSGEEEKDLRNGVVAKQFFESIKIN